MAARRVESQACRNAVLRWAEDIGAAHAGLLLDRALRLPVKVDQHPDERVTIHKAAARALGVARELYKAAFERRLAWVDALEKRAAVASFTVETPPHQRLVIGMGNSSPLEVGLTLHRTYGVPIIPGSALKGIAASAFSTEQRERVVMFGGTSEAGFVTCHDAWMDPECLTDPQQTLLHDVMTPHHGDYYEGRTFSNGPRRGEVIPPTDFDDPNPVSFLSVRGRFQIVLTCEDAGPDGQEWLRIAKRVLIDALRSRGVGGKGSSGYGRLIEVESRG